MYGFIWMCSFISLIAIGGFFYFRHQDKIEQQRKKEGKN